MHFQLPRNRGKDRHGDKYLSRVLHHHFSGLVFVVVVVLTHEMLSRSSSTTDLSKSHARFG